MHFFPISQDICFASFVLLTMAKSICLLMLMISLRKYRHQVSKGLEDRKDFKKISFLLISLALMKGPSPASLQAPSLQCSVPRFKFHSLQMCTLVGSWFVLLLSADVSCQESLFQAQEGKRKVSQSRGIFFLHNAV